MGNKQKPSGHKSQPMVDRYYRKMARPERFELPTTWFEARYSIQLSYGRFIEAEEYRLGHYFSICIFASFAN
jgi:hypothetical protein